MTSRSLLLIDDNDDYVTLVKFFFELNTDWKIITAKNGKEGIAKARQQPDLILLDVVMPSLNGIDVYKMLKSESTTHSIPTIFLTAMMGVQKMVSSQVGEDVEVVTKPMDINVLKNKTKDLYNRYLSAA